MRLCAFLTTCSLLMVGVAQGFSWQTATPKSQGMSSAKLRDLATGLASRGTKGLIVIRNDRIVYEWYARGHGRTTKHHTASMAKALVGGVSLAVAISDGRIAIGDKVAKYVPQWKADPLKSQITIRHLGSHTSGIQDAWVSTEFAAGVDQGSFSGWQGDFWRWRSHNKTTTHDAFTIARDLAPVVFRPGTDYHYSNPGFGMLSYAVTASLKGTAHSDIRSLLRDRVMRPIGVPDDEWSCGYGRTETVDGLPLVASWGGGSYSANATARVARLVLLNGTWEGKQLIRVDAVKQTVSDAETPNNGAMGWWTNSKGDLGKAPRDAFMGEGGGHQVVFIVPSLNLIAVRNGMLLSSSRASELEYNVALRQYLLDPLVNTIVDVPEAANHETRPHPARLPR